MLADLWLRIGNKTVVDIAFTEYLATKDGGDFRLFNLDPLRINMFLESLDSSLNKCEFIVISPINN